MQFKADDGRRDIVILGELQLVLVDRINCKNVVMWLIALRRARTTVAVGADSVRLWMAPLGMSFFFTSPAFCEDRKKWKPGC